MIPVSNGQLDLSSTDYFLESLLRFYVLALFITLAFQMRYEEQTRHIELSGFDVLGFFFFLGVVKTFLINEKCCKNQI